MPEISKYPIYTQLLVHWEALGEVSVLRYKNLLYSSSKRSYCSKSLRTRVAKLVAAWQPGCEKMERK